MIAITVASGRVTVNVTQYNSLSYEARVIDNIVVFRHKQLSRDVIAQGTYQQISLNGNTYDSNQALAVAFNSAIANASVGAQLAEIERGTPKFVYREASNLPQSTVVNIFQVSGGKCVVEIIGEVTATIASGTNNMKLIADPDDGGVDMDMCAEVDIDSDVVGTVYTLTGDVAEVMVASDPGVAPSQTQGMIISPGVIKWSCSASKTGKIKWTVAYIAIDEGAKVEAL